METARAVETTVTGADATRDRRLPVPATETTSRALETDVTEAGRETTTGETAVVPALAEIEAAPGPATTVENRVLLAPRARSVANEAAPLPVVSAAVRADATGAVPALAPNVASAPVLLAATRHAAHPIVLCPPATGTATARPRRDHWSRRIAVSFTQTLGWMRFANARKRPRRTSPPSARPARRVCPCQASMIRELQRRRVTDRPRRSASATWRRLTVTCLPAVTARGRTTWATSATTATGTETATETGTGTVAGTVTATAAIAGGPGHLAGPGTRTASASETDGIVTGTATGTEIAAVTETATATGIATVTGQGTGTTGAADVIEARRCAATVGTGTRQASRC